MTRTHSDPAARRVDVLVVGAGFAGLYLLHRLRGLGFATQVVEAGDDVGGTWYWNRYPGARCDVESMEYSYSFSPELEQEWNWTERYASQPEILRYLQHVADRFGLRRDIAFGTRVERAEHVGAEDAWHVRTDRGETIVARWLVMATGCLSAARLPGIPGRDTFRGRSYHTGHWPHEPVDFDGLTVGVIGTGSTSIQLVPQLAARARRVLVFQRTPNFSLPAHNRPLDPAEIVAVKARYREIREKARRMPAGVASFPTPTRACFDVPEAERERLLEAAWAKGGTGITRVFTDTMTHPRANDVVADFVRRKIRAKVADPAVAEALTPHDHHIATKRICLDTDYFETYDRPNVTLVDVRRDPIVAIEPEGVRTRDARHPVDALVYATGFDAMTGALLAVDVRTDAGRTLREAWAHGPRTYLGLAVAGFPNLFTVTGPGSPSVISNMVVSIEQHVEWITGLLDRARADGVRRIEATAEAQDAWVAHVNAVADATLFPKADSWFVGANVPGKPRVFMPYLGGVGAYRQRCEDVAREGYRGFVLSAGAGGAAATARPSAADRAAG
jgi:cyclohexanone monooxygenase